MKKLIILGAGGNAQEVLWVVDDVNTRNPEWEFLGFVTTSGPDRRGTLTTIDGSWVDGSKKLCWQPHGIMLMRQVSEELKAPTSRRIRICKWQRYTIG